MSAFDRVAGADAPTSSTGGPARIPEITRAELDADVVRRNILEPRQRARAGPARRATQVGALRRGHRPRARRTRAKAPTASPAHADLLVRPAAAPTPPRRSRSAATGSARRVACSPADSPKLLQRAVLRDLRTRSACATSSPSTSASARCSPPTSARCAACRSTSNTDWHQDGAFLGKGIRALNVWVALTDCGVDAPGHGSRPAPLRRASSRPAPAARTSTGRSGPARRRAARGRRTGRATGVPRRRRAAVRRPLPPPHRHRAVDDASTPCDRGLVLRADRLPRRPGPARLVTGPW